MMTDEDIQALYQTLQSMTTFNKIQLQLNAILDKKIVALQNRVDALEATEVVFRKGSNLIH